MDQPWLNTEKLNPRQATYEKELRELRELLRKRQHELEELDGQISVIFLDMSHPFLVYRTLIQTQIAVKAGNEIGGFVGQPPKVTD